MVDTPSRHSLVVVTGMSGAGRTLTLHHLEDLGYQAIDNLPLAAVPDVLDSVDRPDAAATAIGVDFRARDFSATAFAALIRDLRQDERFALTVVFLDCDDQALLRRFSESRRSHPLAAGRPLIDAIREERRRLGPILDLADLSFDSVRLRPMDLRRLLSAQFKLDPSAGMAVFVKSFSFRRGLPSEADLVFDVRFLRNPFYEPDLRAKTGLDADVAAYVVADEAFAEFHSRLTGLIAPLLPRYAQEGKSYLTLGVGCTGGQHRSVCVAESLGAWLRDLGHDVLVSHRDLPQD